MSSGSSHDFDIVAMEALPSQGAVRAEPAMKTVADYVRFLAALAEVFGSLAANHPQVTSGDDFRL
jgi:hypothetical protein